ncbi:MAG TPA: hypothetical protein VG890_10200 [Puia sp.]|nr:hypothetical protein [Puia sp.]
MKPAISYPSISLSENELKGYLFEKWVVNQFPDKDFILREWRSDKHVGNRSANSGMNPDLIFQCRNIDPVSCFAIECKFKTAMDEDNPQWAKEYQLRNYQNFQDRYNMPVFVALGVGGGAYCPKSFSLISLSVLQTVMAPRAVRDKFKREDFPFTRKNFVLYQSTRRPLKTKEPEYTPTWLRK